MGPLPAQHLPGPEGCALWLAAGQPLLSGSCARSSGDTPSHPRGAFSTASRPIEGALPWFGKSAHSFATKRHRTHVVLPLGTRKLSKGVEAQGRRDNESGGLWEGE